MHVSTALRFTAAGPGPTSRFKGQVMRISAWYGLTGAAMIILNDAGEDHLPDFTRDITQGIARRKSGRSKHQACRAN